VLFDVLCGPQVVCLCQWAVKEGGLVFRVACSRGSGWDIWLEHLLVGSGHASE